MSIDWITVAAQIANFLVLVWLLKRFLYRPILDGIDAREREITDRMGEAEQAKIAAHATQCKYQEKLHALQLEQSVMAETIREEAEKKRDGLLADARAHLAQETAAWHAQQDAEARKYTAALHRAGGSALLSLTRKALDDLADDTLEVRMAQHLLAQITPMAQELAQSAGDTKTALVLSHEPLPPAVEHAISAKLETVFDGIQTEFDTDETQSPGIVLRVGGAQLAWTVDSYLDGLEDAMNAQLAKGA